MSRDLEIVKRLKRIKLNELKGRVTHSPITYKTDSNQNVTGLYLNKANLEKIPSVILKLKNLNVLNLANNQLSALPAEIGQLKKLTELNLYNNQLDGVPAEIGQLKELNRLILPGNQLSALPAEIGQLKNLTLLDLSGNQLSALPAEICQLENLTHLYLSNNQLSALPAEIGQLKKLTELNLSNNQLDGVPAEIGQLKKLIVVSLKNNKLISLPKEITELGLKMNIGYYYTFYDYDLDHEDRDRDGIYLAGNPLESPPVEIIEKGRGAVIEYFKSLEEGELPLNEVKVLLVGDGGAGKTSLVKQLLKEDFNLNEPQTHGIDIRDWKVEDINVHFWDFGGQEIMHATHQFFLSNRSLYILVLDGRKDEKTEYWLKHIESFGGDSPVLVVLNKMDEHPGFDVNRRFLQEKYPSIRGFYPVSCKKKKGIKDFTGCLKKALNDVEIIGTVWPESWFDVKTQLEKMTCDFISYEEYKDMCAKEGVKEKSAQNTLVDFLNDLGIILHFRDFELLDTHVLEPEWVTNAVYKIINSKTLANCRGVLRLNCLDDILKKEKDDDYHYPQDRHRYIIDLMKKFELCYKIDEGKVLIPDLLGVSQPEFDFNYKDLLKFVIEYDFLPRSVMPRFIVKMHRDIKENLRWRTGVVLKDEDFNSEAVVKSDNEARKIYIYVSGEQRRDYFAVIMHNLRSINKSFEKLEFDERVCLPDNPEVTVSYSHLIMLEQMRMESFIPEGAKKSYNVRDLLGTIYAEKKNEEEILQILRKLKTRSDTEETLLKKAEEDPYLLQLNFMGIGVDLKKVDLLKKLTKKLFSEEDKIQKVQ